MLILVFLIGFFLLSRISLKLSLLERVGFALPVGLFCITIIMILSDWANIPLSATMLATTTIALLVVAIMLNIGQSKALIASFIPQKINLTWFNILWLIILCVVVWLEAINFEKCMVYPVYDRDSLAAFDTIGYVCAQEQTFHAMSIFDPQYFPHMHEAGSSISYLPMVQLSYAYVYAFGAFSSKAIPGFIYLSFLIGFYGLCRHRLTHTASMLVILGIIMTPEMTAFASLSVTNVMQACMASSGLIYACLWIKKQQHHLLVMSLLLLATNNWMRAEGVVFVLTAALLIFIVSVKRRQWVTAFLPLTALLPLLLWLTYSKACGLTSESAIITHPYWDFDKLSIILNGWWTLVSNGHYYGITFHAAFFAIILNVAFIFMRKSDPYAALALIVSMACYYLILYQVDYKWDSIQNVLNYSAKRFNFCFVPVAWYCFAESFPIDRLFSWIEKVGGLGRSITLFKSPKSK
ncbi:MAG: hypothetical protein PUD79_02280 [Prevotellaceae bacterium]|nr:hypothetical protein [Prevotellaceae bacterium]